MEDQTATQSYLEHLTLHYNMTLSTCMLKMASDFISHSLQGQKRMLSMQPASYRPNYEALMGRGYLMVDCRFPS